MTITDVSNHTILVVDDNGVLRMHAAELLREAGYDVVEAADTAAAMAALEERQGVRLLFTDVQLPAGRDGLSWRARSRTSGPTCFS